jgi:hypothetical protein
MSFGTFELLEVSRKNRASWPTITTMYDHRHCPRRRRHQPSASWGAGRTGNLTTNMVASSCSMATPARSGGEPAHVHDEPDRMKAHEEGAKCRRPSPIHARHTPDQRRGVGAPDFRKRQPSNIIPRVARAYL